VRSLHVRTPKVIRSSIDNTTSVQARTRLVPLGNFDQFKNPARYDMGSHTDFRCVRIGVDVGGTRCFPFFGVAVHRTLMQHRYQHRCGCPRHFATAHRDSRSSRTLQNADDTRCHKGHRSRHTCGTGTLTPVYIGRCERNRRNHSLHQRGDRTRRSPSE
jgi:hypothetical protein